MNDAVSVDGVRYVATTEAAGHVSLSPDYIASLARHGKISARQVGHQWYVDPSSLDVFLVAQNTLKLQRNAELSAQLRRVAEQAGGSAPIAAAYPAHARTPASLIPPEITARRKPAYVFYKLVAAALAIVLTGAAAMATSPHLRAEALQAISNISAVASIAPGRITSLAAANAALENSTSATPETSSSNSNASPISPATSTGNISQPSPATTVVKNYYTQPVIQRVMQPQFLAAADFVTEPELTAQLQSLSSSLVAKFAAPPTTTLPQYVAAGGNSSYPFAALGAIDNLSNVTITNPTVTGGSIPASSITGTLASVIDSAAATIDSLTGTTLNYTNATLTNATTTNATSTNSYASVFRGGSLDITGTSSLAGITLSGTNCSTFGNGGKLTTDAFGNVTCAADQGGSGSTVGGSDTEIQFNSGGSFDGASGFTFASSTGLLTVTSASTTNFTASYASSTNLVAGNATSTNLFASLANVTTGIVSTLSGTELTYTAASTTNISASGEGFFGTASTTNLVVSSAPSGFLLSNAQGQVSATSTFSAATLFGTLGSVNGTPLNAGGSITVAAASSSLLGDSNTFSGSNTFSQTINGSVSGNAGTVTNGVYTTSFGGLFDNRLSATTSLPNLATLAGLSSIGSYTGLLGSQNGTLYQIATSSSFVTSLLAGSGISLSGSTGNVTVTNSIGYPFPGNATSTTLTFGGGFVTGTSTIGTLTATGTVNFLGLGSGFVGSNNGVLYTFSSSTITAASSTLLANNNTFSGRNIFGLINLAATSSSLLATDQNGNVIATTSIGTNLLTGTLGIGQGGTNAASYTSGQLISFNGTGFVSTSTIGNNQLQNSALTVTAGTGLSGGGAVSLGSSTSLSLNLGNANSWTGLQQFTNASTSLFSAYGPAYFGATATSSFGTNGALTLAGLGTFANGFVAQASSTIVGPLTLTGTLSAQGATIQTAASIGTTLAVNGTSGTTTIASGQGFTIGGSQFVVQQGNGNVGIGTTSPTSLLDVAGGVTANYQTGFLGRYSTGASVPLAKIDTGSFGVDNGIINSDIFGPNLNGFTLGGTYAGVSGRADAVTGNSALSFFASTTEAMRIIGNGNVGIGTTSPTSILSVGGDSYITGNVGLGQQPVNTTELSALESSADTVGIGIYSNAQLPLLQFCKPGSSCNYIGMSTTTGSLLFGDGASTVGDASSKMVITSGGNVGIGTTSPNQALDVYGAIAAHSATQSAFVLQQANGNAGFSIGRSESGADGNDFFIYDNVANAHRFNITSSGNVGIGTTTPSESLVVNGAVEVSNAFTNALPSTGGLDYSSGNLRLISRGPNTSTNGGLQILSTESNGGNVFTPLTITSSGDTYLNYSSEGAPGRLNVAFDSNSHQGITIQNTNASAFSGFYLQFQNSSDAEIGSVSESNTAVSYNTTSDRRLKENIATTTAGLATLMQIPVDNFDFINDPTHATVQGFIAQALYPVYPEAVTTNGDNGIVPLGSTSTPWQVDYGRLTPLIVAGVQDIVNIGSTFKQNLIAWLGNAQNGIQNLYAAIGNFGQVNTNDLCVGSTCVTPAQFQAMVAATNVSQPSGQGSGEATPDDSQATDTAPVIQINGDNPAIVQVGATYQDLGATITGPQQDLNLGIETYLNGTLASNIVVDTSAAATDTIDYIATDQNGLASTSTRTVIIEAAQTRSIVRLDNSVSTTTPQGAATTTSTPNTSGTSTTP